MANSLQVSAIGLVFKHSPQRPERGSHRESPGPSATRRLFGPFTRSCVGPLGPPVEVGENKLVPDPFYVAYFSRGTLQGTAGGPSLVCISAQDALEHKFSTFSGLVENPLVGKKLFSPNSQAKCTKENIELEPLGNKSIHLFSRGHGWCWARLREREAMARLNGPATSQLGWS